MSERMKEKLSWFIVKLLPKRVVLYAFVYVHGLRGEAPLYDGEYSQAYKLWTKTYGLL